jgi:ABC-2 type transport system permease protein
LTVDATRTGAILLRHFYLVRGSLTRVVPLFAWVAIDIVLWGFIARYLNAVAGSGLDFVPLLLGAVLLWDFCSRVMYGVTTAFFEDVWSRNFLNLFATPLTLAEYLGGLVASSVVTSAVGLLVMLLLATGVFGLSFFMYGLAILPFLMVLFLFGVALGIVGSGVVLRLGPAAEWFIWPVPALLSPFVAVFYPLATLPPWMRSLAYALPPSYVFEGMRTILAGGAVPTGLLALGSALAVAYVALACRFFVRVYRYAIQTGLLAKYSAESVN